MDAQSEWAHGVPLQPLQVETRSVQTLRAETEEECICLSKIDSAYGIQLQSFDSV